MKTILIFLVSLAPLSSPAFAENQNYDIAAKFVSSADYSACNTLEIAKTLAKDDANPNLNADQKKRDDLVKDLLKDQLSSLNSDLSSFVATVTISFELPASLQLNRDAFFVDTLDGKHVGTFASDALADMDESGKIVRQGTGRGSYNFELHVAAYCSLVSKTNPNPSLESVLQNIVQ